MAWQYQGRSRKRVLADGKISEGIIDLAAEMAVLGIDPLPFLRSRNSLEHAIYIKLRDKAAEKRDIQMSNFASEIAKRFSG